MNMHEIIRNRRRELGLTQEQLAGKLGVSAPAVNKWERAGSYPDITLLPVLARTLGVDLNTLLSFQEDLTDQEIGMFLNTLHEAARAEGFDAAFARAEEKLREFPGNDRLAYSVAVLLEGLLCGGPEQRQEEIGALYERCRNSADPQVREWAVHALAIRLLKRGELDRAETLLEALSDTHRGKRETLAALRRRQGRTGEAWTLLERELFDHAHGLQTVLLKMIEWALEEGDWAYARLLSDRAEQAGACLDLSDYAVLSAPLQLALAEQDGPQAIRLLERMLRSLASPWDLSESPLYRHLLTKDAAGEAQTPLIFLLLDEVERDQACAFLWELPEYRALLQRWRTP